jgi:hypothetical protein
MMINNPVKRLAITGALAGLGALAVAGMTIPAQAQGGPSPGCINKYNNPYECWPYNQSYQSYYPYAGYGYPYAPPPGYYYGYPPYYGYPAYYGY